MPDRDALRRVGLTFGAITVLVTLLATTMVLRTTHEDLLAAALASVVE